MGRVFTWESIQARRIPKYESFQSVAKILRERLSIEPSVVSALLFGSIVRGDFDVRSNIDCLVIYKIGEEMWAMETMQKIDRIAHTLHVPINFTPCDTILFKTRLHHLGSFVKHLQTSADTGGLIKGNVVEMLTPTISVKQEIESYIKIKMYGMQESLAQVTTFSEDRLTMFLKRALEVPMHVAHKMLIYEGTLLGDSKKEVREQYCRTMPADLTEQLKHLLCIDSWYSSELVLQIETNSPDKYRYEIVLARLQQELPKVLEFLRSNILRISEAEVR